MGLHSRLTHASILRVDELFWGVRLNVWPRVWGPRPKKRAVSVPHKLQDDYMGNELESAMTMMGRAL